MRNSNIHHHYLHHAGKPKQGKKSDLVRCLDCTKDSDIITTPLQPLFTSYQLDQGGVIQEWVLTMIKQHSFFADVFTVISVKQKRKFRQTLDKHITLWAPVVFVVFSARVGNCRSIYTHSLSLFLDVFTTHSTVYFLNTQDILNNISSHIK